MLDHQLRAVARRIAPTVGLQPSAPNLKQALRGAKGVCRVSCEESVASRTQHKLPSGSYSTWTERSRPAATGTLSYCSPPSPLASNRVFAIRR